MSTYWEDLAKNPNLAKLKPAKGKILDHYGVLVDLPRKRYLLVFKEFDYFYRKRLLKTMLHPRGGLHD